MTLCEGCSNRQEALESIEELVALARTCLEHGLTDELGMVLDDIEEIAKEDCDEVEDAR